MKRAGVADRPFTGLVAAGVALAAVAAALAVPLALRPADADAATPSRQLVPSDMVGWAIEECMEVIPETDRYVTVFPLGWNVSPGGRLHALVGGFVMEELESGGYASTDETSVNVEASALVDECLGSRRFEQEPAFREPTAGERLVLHDWVRRVQEPCLAAHGIPFESPGYATLMNPGEIPWRMPVMPDADFETRLGIRQACPPIPEWLHDDGIFGW